MFLEYAHNPATWETLYTYCKIDVKTEELLDTTLPDLNASEQEIWFLNQKLNWRGLRIDIPTVTKIVAIMELESKAKLEELDTLTMGLVTKPGARKSILEFLALDDIILPDIRAKTVEDALRGGGLTEDMRRLLEIRKALSKTSTKKYQSFIARAGLDDRVRDILLYHGASTGRDTGTGIQPHNFPRGAIKVSKERPYAAIENVIECDADMLRLLYGESLAILFSSILRNMILPSEGCELFVADFSKIEVAVLWWVADNKPGLLILNSGLDPYKYMAAANTSRAYEEIADEGDERQLGKAQVLGCIAEGTSIFTLKGVKPIERLIKRDKIWDGQNFVKHGGLVRKGLKPVIRIASRNIIATHDHWVKQSNVWRSVGEIALSKGMRPRQSGRYLRDGRLLERRLKSGRNAVSYVAAYVELKKQLESIDYGWVKQNSVLRAVNLLIPENPSPVELATLLVTQGLESVGKLVSITSKKDARGGMIKTLRGMEVAEFEYPLSPVESLWNTLLHLTGLTSGGSHWTELITTGTMSPEIYESRLSELTTEIKATFDIQKVGYLNQFQAGNCIAHNCGFGMGWRKFQKTAYDQYRLKLTAVQSRAAVATYREANEAVPELWKNYEQAAIIAIEDGVTTRAGKCKFFTKDNFLWIELPSGRRLAYREPQISWRIREYEVTETDDDGEPILDKNGDEITRTEYTRPQKTVEFMAVNSKTKKWSLERTWGGTLTENIVQAIARDLMMQASVRLERAGYRMLLSVHDEALTEREVGEGDVKQFEEIMCRRPAWADSSLPIQAKAWTGPRYRK